MIHVNISMPVPEMPNGGHQRARAFCDPLYALVGGLDDGS